MRNRTRAAGKGEPFFIMLLVETPQFLLFDVGQLAALALNLPVSFPIFNARGAYRETIVELSRIPRSPSTAKTAIGRPSIIHSYFRLSKRCSFCRHFEKFLISTHDSMLCDFNSDINSFNRELHANKTM